LDVKIWKYWRATAGATDALYNWSGLLWFVLFDSHMKTLMLKEMEVVSEKVFVE
jgi:hypothetical protein